MTKRRVTKRSNLPLNALRSFEAAARLGRQHAAAEELLVTHGAISRQICKLEEYLGLDLFSGAKRTPELTPEGQRLLEELTPAFDQLDAAVRRVLDEKERVLRVSCYSTFAMLWLIPRLSRFREIHPDIVVQLSTDSADMGAARMAHDLKVLLLDSKTDLGPHDSILVNEKLGYILSPRHLTEGVAAKPDLLCQIPQIATSTRLDAWLVWVGLTGMDQAFQPQSAAMIYEHYSFAIEAVTNGLGGCVAPYHLIVDRLDEGRLVAPFGFVESKRTYVARSVCAPNRRSKAFITWLQNELT
ncbi:LysR substrate-binding domain-containing protein [Roseinatronobacter alkalisoli]|uniref:LysR substrate-binding domain-containing protein n=1 Tax=Roseinatronobacter alkalisoli TaxID=3028235 RepID=A0ABT5TES9_9RHOB|nr:LysR substrate-binding domain-containing protein [Roseinatronobacter sp. HJB301]MDD7973633.1 LysR substrate-binding domain-containing protein [Roseinatronobacter sp. HJB301]